MAGATPAYTQVPTQGTSQKRMRKISRGPLAQGAFWATLRLSRLEREGRDCPGRSRASTSLAGCAAHPRCGRHVSLRTPQPQAQHQIGPGGPWPQPSGPEVGPCPMPGRQTFPPWGWSSMAGRHHCHTQGRQPRAAQREGTQSDETGVPNSPGVGLAGMVLSHPPREQDTRPSPLASAGLRSPLASKAP